jgi:hypothetical protein
MVHVHCSSAAIPPFLHKAAITLTVDYNQGRHSVGSRDASKRLIQYVRRDSALSNKS